MTALDWLAPGWQPLGWLPLDPALRLAAIVALGLALVTVLVLAQVLALSAWAAGQRRRRDAFNALWRPQLALASLDDRGFPKAAPPRGPRRLWWLMLWNRMQRQLRGDATRRLNRLARLMGFQRYAVQLLRRPGVRRRLVALETLRHLGDPQLWTQVAPLCRARNPFVALAAAQALVAMDAAGAVRLVLTVGVERADWSGYRLAGLCRSAGREAVTPALLHALETAPVHDRHRLVPLLEFAEPSRVAAWCRECVAADPDPRNREAALQVLGQLGDPRDHERLTRALTDPEPTVRLAALAALRRQARPDDADVLLGLLGDRSWWVRRQAADALANLPGLAEPAARALLPKVADAYGREALQRAIAERAAQARLP